MLSTPCRSVREVLNHTALKPDLVIRAMYRQDKIYGLCTAKTIDTLPIPKMSIVRFLLLTLATIMHPPCAPKSFNFKAFSESVHCTK